MTRRLLNLLTARSLRWAPALMILGPLSLGCVSPRYYYSGGGYGPLVDPESGQYRASLGLSPPASAKIDPVPARLAVAEIGEWAPPDVVMDALRERRDLFAKVSAVPGRGQAQYYGGTELAPSLTRSTGEAVADAVDAARGAGADYLLLLSAYAHTGTAQAVRGVPPERQTRALIHLCQWTEGRSAAVLVDVRDRTVLLTRVKRGGRRDPAVLPGIKRWFYGWPSTLLSRSMMLSATRQLLSELSRRMGPSGENACTE